MDYERVQTDTENLSSALQEKEEEPFAEQKEALLAAPDESATASRPELPDLMAEDRQLFHCDLCKQDISFKFRIRCAICVDYDLCVKCFVTGPETETHKNYHDYIPIGRNQFPLFHDAWTADEELMLLQGVCKFGLGNWTEVAEFVLPFGETAKKRDQCEDHYYSVYVNPFLANNIPRPDMPKFSPTMSSEETDKLLREINTRMVGSLYPMPPAPIRPRNSTTCNVVGFMPLRGDFDIEYDNDAELILADLEFRGDEAPLERELKLKVLDIYNAKLNQRYFRKQVVVEKNFADWKRLGALDKKRPKEEADLIALFRLLARFDLAVNQEELVKLILSEKNLKERVAKLQEWRALGFSSYQQVEDFEKSKLASISGTPVFPEMSSEHLSSEEYRLNGPVSSYPGAALLNETEVEFCEKIQMPPIYFLLVKNSLIRAMSSSECAHLLDDNLVLDVAKHQTAILDFVLHGDYNIVTQQTTNGIPVSIPSSSIPVAPSSPTGRIPRLRYRRTVDETGFETVDSGV